MRSTDQWSYPYPSLYKFFYSSFWFHHSGLCHCNGRLQTQQTLPPIPHANLKLNVNDMTCSCFSNSKSIDSSHHSLDHVPLSQRLKLLHPPILQNDTRIPLTLQFDAVVKKEHEGCDSQVNYSCYVFLLLLV